MFKLRDDVIKTLLREEDLRNIVYHFPLDEMTALLFNNILKRYEVMSEFIYNVFCNAVTTVNVDEYSGTSSDIFDSAIQELMESEVVYHCSETMVFTLDEEYMFDMEIVLSDIGFTLPPQNEVDNYYRSVGILHDYLKHVFNSLLGFPHVHEAKFCFILLSAGLMSFYVTERY